MNAQNDTQREADEIIKNVTADFRAGLITFEDWLQLTRIAMKDGYLSELCESEK